jgi:N-acetyl-gamma-glutamyl-phosphate reductase
MHIHAGAMQTASVGIIGASGYSGLELTRLLLGHHGTKLVFATSDRWVGQRLEARVGRASALHYVSVDEGLAQAKDCDVVFLATPAETSYELGPKLVALGVKVVDLAGTFRLKNAALYPPFYKLTHAQPALLAEAVYGLPELFRDEVKGARYLANPGCYATAATLSLAPLFRNGLVVADSVVVSAASGVSGAGRKATEDYSFMEIDGDFRAYKVLGHQHTPEIEQTLARVGGAPVSMVFTPHLLPLKRGIVSTAVATLKPGVTQAQVSSAFADAYGGEALVKLLPSPEAVRIADVVNTPKTHLGVACDGKRVVSIAALDNLLKGAASQAVQNYNLMSHFLETEGL